MPQMDCFVQAPEANLFRHYITSTAERDGMTKMVVTPAANYSLVSSVRK